MFAKETLHFLTELKANNHKEWMDAHKKQYEVAKKDFEVNVQAIIEGITAFDTALTGVSPKQCIFRINRDVRFSTNKDPYKSNFGAAFSANGRKCENACYYIHLEPGNAFVGGGCWMPPADALKKIRQEIDYDFDTFKSIINQKDFKKLYPEIDGEKLKKAPQGYDTENVAIEFLKHKSFTVGMPISDKQLSSKNAIADILHAFKTLKPFNDFLNRAFE